MLELVAQLLHSNLMFHRNAAYGIVQSLKPHLELVRVVRVTPESRAAKKETTQE